MLVLTAAVAAAVQRDDTAARPTRPVVSKASMGNVLRDIGHVNCSADVRRRTYQLLYASNRGLHDACVKAAQFQIFPYSGQPPTPAQITQLVASPPCCLLLTGVVLARFPECDVEFFSVRSAAEVLLRIRSDVEMGHAPPSTTQFQELYAINRVSNLLQQNATQVMAALEHSAVLASVSELTRMMRPVKTARGVALTANMTIVLTNPRPPSSSMSVAPSPSPSGTAVEPSKAPVSSSATGVASDMSRRHHVCMSATMTLLHVMMMRHVGGS
ncbi:hypothetical protein PINS_up022064 [Pythium insidiosum]|nr:hypothetical protein PINS_up011533 [Pythium insidiosum]GLE05718.1 hypothetical protein PINS_up014764 [Pythium insidiosum]GLE08896.1 hypothetical protein PINS_up020364 [Pythium insidiosum]GLE10069.1 hypothetical protein PINS_up022064 [Pythium insidiosum]